MYDKFKQICKEGKMKSITQYTGEIENLLSETGEIALRYFEEMKFIISKIINQIKNYNRACEESDYWSEAFLAIQQGVIKYNKFRNFSVDFNEQEDFEIYLLLQNNPSMKFQTFAYWYLQKRLYKLADMGDVEFVVEMDGKEIAISSEEYHKNRKKYNGDVKSVQKVYSFTELALINSDGEKEYEPVNYEDFEKIHRHKKEV